MKTFFLSVLALCVVCANEFAQPAPGFPASLPGPRPWGGGSPAKPSLTNYQLELNVRRAEKVARYRVTLNGGSVSTELMDRLAEDQEGGGPRTMAFNVNFSPFEDGGGEAAVTLNRSLAFKAKVSVPGAPPGTEREVTQLKSVPLMTKIVLFPGNPVILFEDDEESISLRLSVLDGDEAEAARCIRNLRMIDGAKQQWALENRQKEDSEPDEAEIAKFIKGGMPHCPGGGVYTLGKVGEPPTCSIPTHRLDAVTHGPRQPRPQSR